MRRSLDFSSWGWVVGASVLTAVLGGCGGGGAPDSGKAGAASQVKAAKDALERGTAADMAGRVNDALMAYNEARSQIAQGKPKAKDHELKSFKALEEELGQKEPAAQWKKTKQDEDRRKKQQEEEEAKRLAEEEKKKGKPKGDMDDPEAAKRKLVEIANKKAAEEQKKSEEALNLARDTGTVKKAGGKKDEDAEAGTVAAKTPGGEQEKGGEGGEKPKPAGDGLYKSYSNNAPAMSVDRVTYRGNYVFVYFQVFNKNEMGKRIGKVDVAIKDAGNGVLETGTFTFTFEGFNKDAKDPTDQPNGKCALTASSHEVPGNNSLKLVSVAEVRGKANKAAKAAVTINYDDGKTDSDSGPSSVLEGDKPMLPGTK